MIYTADELALIERARTVFARRDERERKERHAQQQARYRALHPRSRRRPGVAEMRAAREREYQIRGYSQGPLMHAIPVLDDEGLAELVAVL